MRNVGVREGGDKPSFPCGSSSVERLRGCGSPIGCCVALAVFFSSVGAATLPHSGERAVGRIHFVADGISDVTLASVRVTIHTGADSVVFGTPPGGGALVSLGVARNCRGDGYDAILLGLRSADAAQRTVNVYFGGAAADTTPDLSLQSPEPGDLFGTVVVGIGDINGDGYGDFAVGAPAADAGRGKVYVYLGASSPSTTPALVLSGTAPGDLFGSAIAGAGRLDGDDYPDFAVGAPGGSGGAGSVYLFAGGTTLPSTPAAILAGDTPAGYAGPARFGAVLAGGADLDRDQHDDLVVSAPGRDGGKGSVWFYRGGSSWPSTAAMRLDGVEPFGHFGAALALDSLQAAWANADLVIGIPGASKGAGKVSVFTGGPSLSTTPGLEFSGFHADDRLGTSVAVHRETSQDLSGTLLMGAPFRDDPSLNAGAVYRFAATPSVGVEAAAIAALDGVPLNDGQFVSARPTFQLLLPGAAGVDLAASRVTIDSVEVAPQAVSPASVRLAGTSSVSGGGGLEVTLQLADGEHVLHAHLVSTTHEVSGSIQIRFRVAAHLALLAPRIWPQPARGIAHIGFTLTRPADYAFELYDVQGRRVLLRTVAQGVPDWNEFQWDGGVDGGRANSGIFFYTLTARYQGEESKVRGRIVLVR
jgi:hypothetical protein